MKNYVFIIIVLCVFFFAGYAQEPVGNLGSDRPGATFSANTVGQWVLQVQSGVNYTQVNHDLLDYTNAIGERLTQKYGEDQFNTATDLRFGLYKSFEIGLSLKSSNLTIHENFNNEPNSYASSMNPNLIIVPSLRATAINNDNFQLGIMLAYDLTDYVGDVFVSRIMASYALTEHISIAANLSQELGISTTSEYEDVYGYTLNLGYSFNKLTLFVENYGGLGVSKIDDNYETSFNHFFNAGAYYLLTENIQLDATLNFGYNQQKAPFFLNTQNRGVQQAGAALGITWRFFAN